MRVWEVLARLAIQPYHFCVVIGSFSRACMIYPLTWENDLQTRHTSCTKLGIFLNEYETGCHFLGHRVGPNIFINDELPCSTVFDHVQIKVR